jgi:hypothetical protein
MVDKPCLRYRFAPSRGAVRIANPVQGRDDVDQTIEVDPAVAHILFELFDGVHASS